jgi:hypothetical protein
VRTDELIHALATGAGPAATGEVPRRYAIALTLGALGAVVLVAIHFGFNPRLAEVTSLPKFWVRELFVASVAATSLVALARLARPGVALGHAAIAMLVPLLGIWTLAGFALALAAPDARAGLVLGSTWRECPYNIALVALPALAALLWAVRGLAPTRPALAGAAAGVLAGGLGALAYTLHCPEIEAPFLAVWYVLGMAIPALAGAAIGARLLRW